MIVLTGIIIIYIAPIFTRLQGACTNKSNTILIIKTGKTRRKSCNLSNLKKNPIILFFNFFKLSGKRFLKSAHSLTFEYCLGNVENILKKSTAFDVYWCFVHLSLVQLRIVLSALDAVFVCWRADCLFSRRWWRIGTPRRRCYVWRVCLKSQTASMAPSIISTDW